MEDPIVLESPSQNRRFLMAKALGFTTAISKLSREERSKNPSGTLGQDYNKLRQVVLESFPFLASYVPPEVEISQGMHGGTFTHEMYGEVYTFCEQLYQLLAVLESG